MLEVLSFSVQSQSKAVCQKCLKDALLLKEALIFARLLTQLVNYRRVQFRCDIVVFRADPVWSSQDLLR